MGIDGAEWDHLGSGAVFGFHGLHLWTEAIAAFGELLRCGSVRHGRQIVPRTWVELAANRQIEGRRQTEGDHGPDFRASYGYQIWMSRHGFHGRGAFGQYCVVVPEHELVVSVTGAQTEVRHAQDLLDALWERLIPGIDRPDSAQDDGALVDRLHGLSLPQVDGELRPEASVTARLDASPEGSALPYGTEVIVEPNGNGWRLHLGADLSIETGHRTWRESSPLGRPRRRIRCLAGCRAHRRPVRHHQSAPSPFDGRRQHQDSDGRLDHSTPDQPRPSGAPPRAALDATRRRLTHRPL
ncbi:MAG: hypothetical protein ACRDNS_27490 [Trebonia sp.]